MQVNRGRKAVSPKGLKTAGLSLFSINTKVYPGYIHPDAGQSEYTNVLIKNRTDAKTNMRRRIVSVIGGRRCSKEVEQMAIELGKKLAKVVGILVCGGLSGTMKAICVGFKAGNGLTIGFIPGYDKNDANEFVDIVIPTGLGLARNVLVVKAADVIVALPGEAGTLSEIAYCLQFGIPVISLKSWDIPGVIKAENIKDAINKVREFL